MKYLKYLSYGNNVCEIILDKVENGTILAPGFEHDSYVYIGIGVAWKSSRASSNWSIMKAPKSLKTYAIPRQNVILQREVKRSSSDNELPEGFEFE